MLQKQHGFWCPKRWNRISELLDFKFFWGSMPPEPPREKGACSPFSGHSCLLHLQWPLITKVIETPDKSWISCIFTLYMYTTIFKKRWNNNATIDLKFIARLFYRQFNSLHITSQYNCKHFVTLCTKKILYFLRQNA